MHVSTLSCHCMICCPLQADGLVTGQTETFMYTNTNLCHLVGPTGRGNSINWNEIAKRVPLRNNKDCRKRYLNGMAWNLKKVSQSSSLTLQDIANLSSLADPSLLIIRDHGLSRKTFNLKSSSEDTAHLGWILLVQWELVVLIVRSHQPPSTV